MKQRGYFGIGIENTKTEANIGTLWRSANLLGASFIFTINKRYKSQSSDTMQTPKHIPLYHYDSFADFYRSMPLDCKLIGVELDNRSIMLNEYKHPERCIYLLGAEDNGLSKEALSSCHDIVQLFGEYSMNVSVAGSIIIYDRLTKQIKPIKI